MGNYEQNPKDRPEKLQEIDNIEMKVEEIALGIADLQNKERGVDSVYDQVYSLVEDFNLTNGRELTEILIKKCQENLVRYSANKNEGINEALEALSDYTIV